MGADGICDKFLPAFITLFPVLMSSRSSSPPRRSNTTARTHGKPHKQKKKRRATSGTKLQASPSLPGSMIVSSVRLQPSRPRADGAAHMTQAAANREIPSTSRSPMIVKPVGQELKQAPSPKLQKLLPVLESTVPFFGEYVYGLSSVVHYTRNFMALDPAPKATDPLIKARLINASIVKRIRCTQKVSISLEDGYDDTSDEDPPTSLTSSTAEIPDLPLLKNPLKSSKPSKSSNSQETGSKVDKTVRAQHSFSMFMVPSTDNAIMARYGSLVISTLKQFEKRLSYITVRLASDSSGPSHPRNIVIFKGGYVDFKKYFLDKGWVVNPDKDTPTDFNIKFAIKVADIDRTRLHPWQYTNHFTNSQVLTTKSGLTKTLSPNNFDIDITRFFPQSYRVVNASDANSQAQLQLMSANDETLDFLEDFLNTEVVKICFDWVHDPKICDSMIDWESSTAETNERTELTPSSCFKYSIHQLQISYRHLLYLTSTILHHDLELNKKTRFVVPPITQYEMGIILPRLPRQYKLPDFYGTISPQSLFSSDGETGSGPKGRPRPGTLFPATTAGPVANGSEPIAAPAPDSFSSRRKEQFSHPYSAATDEIHANAATAQEYHHMVRALGVYLQHAPQVSIRSSMQNIFIGKPGAKSRGRGIFCSNDILKLLVLDEHGGTDSEFELPDEAAVNSSDRYIIQRYLETPLLLGGYKFDIRQWVFVSSINPLIIFQWTSPYLRFCSSKYSLDEHDLKNPYIHLSNNSVQKCSEQFGKDDEFLGKGNMWDWTSFSDYLDKMIGDKPWLDLLLERDPQYFCYHQTEDFKIRAPPTSTEGTEMVDILRAQNQSKSKSQSKSQSKLIVTENKNKNNDEDAETVETNKRKAKSRPYKQKYETSEHAKLYGPDLYGNQSRIKTEDYKHSQYTDKAVFNTIADRILYDMARIIITTVQAARFELTSADNNFELLGYDFIIDSALQVWLVEINASPTLEHSTEVVTKLIDKMSRGLVNIIVDSCLGTKIKTKKKIVMPKISNASAVFGSGNGASALEDWKLIYCEKQKLSQYSADITAFGKEISIPGVIVRDPPQDKGEAQ
ncbi:Tubulin--tyrosine ligase [Giardia duodenalis]|uniref:Tubulin--tyrosine ligase n=1 Tax=Giardia intestinalis TaxID=5741 RepID=V6TQZ9_GIAIN|nr:Tubulin--tyrosine ligase [Giardia intestinalis]